MLYLYPKVINGKISASSWFAAQYLINEQKFFGKAMKILSSVRAMGFDVKVDMQSNKLVWDGGMIDA